MSEPTPQPHSRVSTLLVQQPDEATLNPVYSVLQSTGPPAESPPPVPKADSSPIPTRQFPLEHPLPSRNIHNPPYFDGDYLKPVKDRKNPAPEGSTEADFLAKHNRGWQHGVRTPYTTFKYHKEHNISTKNRFNKANDMGVFSPTVVLEPVENSAYAVDPKTGKTIPPPDFEDKSPAPLDPTRPIDENVSRKDTGNSIFSAHFMIPKVSLNVPSYRSTDKISNFDVMPQLCYHNHFDWNDLTFTFGGLFVSKISSFEHLGIPKNVSLDKISVYFPCELPPFVNKEILSNPFMSQNLNFYMFNPERGSVTYLDTLVSPDTPGNINALLSTRISDRHIFFYGGFIIDDESVEYKQEIDRWIIKKKLSLNRHGYILDRITYRFSKVELKCKDGEDTHAGRLGAGIASSVFVPDDSRNSNTTDNPPMRAPSPLIFAENSSSSSNPGSGKLHPKSPYTQASQHKHGPNDNFKLPDSSTNLESISSVTTSHNEAQSKSFKKEPGTPLVSSVSSYLNTKSISKVSTNQTSNSSYKTPIQSTPNIPKSGTESPVSSKPALSGSLKTNTSTVEPDSASDTPTSAGPKPSKMSSVLSKSSRIFHRSSHQRQASNGTPKSPQTQPHSLKNTYSKQVKQHRSNSQHSSNESRPVSPVQLSLLQKPKPEPVKVESIVPEGASQLQPPQEKSPQVQIRIPTPPQEQQQTDISQHSRSPPESRSTTPISIEKFGRYGQTTGYAEYASLSTSDSLPAPPKAEDDLHSSTAFQNHERNRILFHESILKTGISGVTIFVFGGFKPIEGEDGILRFSATNEFMKIDLASKDDNNGGRFHEEGLVFDITSRCQSMADDVHIWPSPRGYFASALVHDDRESDNCNTNIFAESDIESLSSRRGNSPVSISSENSSFKTISSGRVNKLALQGPDTFFKGKSLLVQGGCNDEGQTFSDFYLFSFDTGQWRTISTYAYDYFELPLQPFEDEDGSKLSRERQVEDAALIEAELRSCHHTALFYENEGRNYLFFMGGFRNDFLRHFDKEPYHSDKFEVTRLSNFSFSSNNNNTSRIPILNLRTQTWSFLRYYYDVAHILSEPYLEKLNFNPLWVNARIANYGGSISMNDKSITICHGLALPVPQKRENWEKMREEIPLDLLLWGAHVHFTFPNL